MLHSTGRHVCSSSCFLLQLAVRPMEASTGAADLTGASSRHIGKPEQHIYCKKCLTNIFEIFISGASRFPPQCCKNLIRVEKCYTLLPSELVENFYIKMEEISTTNPIYCSSPSCAKFIQPTQIKDDIGTCSSCGKKTCALCKTSDTGKQKQRHERESTHRYQRSALMLFECQAHCHTVFSTSMIGPPLTHELCTNDGFFFLFLPPVFVCSTRSRCACSSRTTRRGPSGSWTGAW